MQFVRPYRGQLGITLVTCGIGRVVAFIGVGVLGALILARGAQRRRRPALLVIALLICAPLAGLLHWLESWIAHAMAYALLAEMRIDLFRKLDALAPAYLLRRRSGDLVALATQDVETVEYFFAHTIAPGVRRRAGPPAVMPRWVGSPGRWRWSGAVPAYAGAVAGAGAQRIDRLGRPRAARWADRRLRHRDDPGPGRTGRCSTPPDRRREAFMGAVRGYQALRLKLLADLSLQAGALEVATGLGGLASPRSVPCWSRSGGLEAAQLPLVVLISVAAFMPVSEIAQVGRQLADTIASTRRLHVVHAEPETITDGPVQPRRWPAGPPWRSNVGFTYPGRAVPALREMSFACRPARPWRWSGPPARARRTMANLLLRFWDPEAGAIRLDGVDLRELTLDGLRGRIALVAQDTYLFNDTLEANVRLARPDATEEQIGLALSRAALSEFVAGLPEGLRHGRRTRRALSGGQRQRIAIARAFLKDAPLLILDEATSHLDTVNEAGGARRRWTP